MSTSAFWSHISTRRDVRTAQETLRRNHEGALIVQSLYSYQSDTEQAAVIKLALSQVHRWKAFFLIGEYQKDLFADIEQRASVLEGLCVDLTSSADPSQAIRLPNSQSLRYLSLYGISLDWGSSRLGGLWSLSLHSIDHGPSLAQFHSTLSSSPLLNILYLYRIKSVEQSTTSTSPIRLPFLASLCLHSIPNSLLSLLSSHIEASACTSIIIDGINLALYNRALTLASNAIRLSSKLEVQYDSGPEKTTIRTSPDPIVTRFRGGITRPGASISVKGARLDEILLKILDAFACREVDPTVRVHVSRSVDHGDETFAGAQVVLKGFQELYLPLQEFLLEKVSREWLGERAFIYELGEALQLGNGAFLKSPGL